MSWLFIYTLFEWTTRIVMIPVVLRRRIDVSTKLDWLGVIFFIPVVGLPAYLLIGDRRLGTRRSRMHAEAARRSETVQMLAVQQAHIQHPAIDPALQPMIRQAEVLGSMAILGEHHVDFLDDTDATIDTLITDVDRATDHVHLLTYIYAADATGRRVIEALSRAAERGVVCRLLVDAVGSRSFLRHNMCAAARSAGVQVQSMLDVNPLRRGLARIDLRNHRKIAVIDGRIAYAGSQNVVNADYGHKTAGQWYDLTGRFTGPIVSQLQRVFCEDWAYETDEHLAGDTMYPSPQVAGEMVAQCVPTGPSQGHRDIRRVLLSAINMAQRKVIITTPYLVLDEPMEVALSMAADRGAQVVLVVPERSDHRLVSAAGHSFYEGLLEAGVHIHQYHPGLLHAKTITVDDDFALLGSANLDMRSFFLNFEINVLMYGSQITQRLRFAQSRYINDSTPISLAQWRRRPVVRQYLEASAALLSPIL